MQQMQVFITAKPLYMFRASTDPNKATLEVGRCPDTWYDMYQKLSLQFDVLLMMGSVDARNM